ncbi:MAG: hypothetical protein M3Q56_00670 [Bacteroidota bacterium]|nr:hypothetical protein [Bacteroidota bacterium]
MKKKDYSLSWFACDGSCNISLLFFTVVFMFAGLLQSKAQTPSNPLPPLKSKIESVEIAKQELVPLKAYLEQFQGGNPNPNDPVFKRSIVLFGIYTHIVNFENDPAYDMNLILFSAYPMNDPTPHVGSTAVKNIEKFYNGQWYDEFTEVVNKLRA